MIELLRVMLALLIALCLILGWWARGWYDARYGKPKFIVGKTIVEVSVTPVDKRRLVSLGMLPEGLGKWVAGAILDGRPFTFTAMLRKHKQGGKLSEAQFKSVRADFVDRRVATYDTVTGKTTLHPPAFAVCRKFAGRRK